MSWLDVIGRLGGATAWSEYLTTFHTAPSLQRDISADLYGSLSTRFGINCVRQEIDQGLLQLALIGTQHRRVIFQLCFKLDTAFLCAYLDRRHEGTNELVDFDVFFAQFVGSGFDLGYLHTMQR